MQIILYNDIVGLMLFNFKNIKRSWFTLVEVLLVCSVFAIMVIWIILAVNRSYAFMNNVRLQVRATNFTREWVEMMFNIRDTSWRRNSWEKDKYRLSNGYTWMIASSDKYKVLNGWVLTGWIYVLKEKTTGSWDTYFYASWLIIWNSNKENNFYGDWFWDESTEYTKYREAAKLSFTWTYYYPNVVSWVLYAETWSIQELLWSEADFYRILRVYGVYCKNVSSSNNTSGCPKDSDPKELRFCVKVFYRNLWDPHSTELCSIMTNFEG